MTIPPPPGGYGVRSDPGAGRHAAPPVSFATAVRRGLTVWTVEGRASRSEFWWFALFLAAVLVGVSFVAGRVQAAVGSGDGAGARGIASAILWWGFLPFVVKVAIRRYHDSGRGGGLFALHLVANPVATMVALVSTLAALAGLNENIRPLAVVGLAGVAVAVFVMVASGVWMVVTLCRSGQDEPNRFDPPPTPAAGQAVPVVASPDDGSTGQAGGQASTA